jgi:hypothetical protein
MIKDYNQYKSNISITGYGINEITTNDNDVLQALVTKGLNINQTIGIVESIKITKFGEFILNNVNDNDDKVRLFLIIDLYKNLDDPNTMLKMIGINSSSGEWNEEGITYDDKTISFDELGSKIEKLIPETNSSTSQDIKAINLIKQSVEAYSSNIVNISGSGMINISQTNQMIISINELLSEYQGSKVIDEEIIHERIIGVLIILIFFIIISSFMSFLDKINRLEYQSGAPSAMKRVKLF